MLLLLSNNDADLQHFLVTNLKKRPNYSSPTFAATTSLTDDLC